MRIAHFDTGRAWRGGQAQVLYLMRGLRARGHDGVLFAPGGPLAERAGAEGLAVVRWRPRIEWDPVAILGARRALLRHGLELAHAHTARAHASGGLAARLAKLPLVVSRRVPLPVAGHPLSALKYRHGVERYLCVSRSVADVLRRSGIEERRIAVVPSGVDLDAPARHPEPGLDLRAQIGARPDSPVVGTVGSLTAEKDHGALLEAARLVVERVREVRFVWIGEGERRAVLEAERDRLGLAGRVHLLGFREDAPALMRQLTLLAQSSRFEGLGNAVLEAQAAGIPVVATAVGGVPELIEDGVSGRLVPARDPVALAAAIVEGLIDPAARARWSAGARDSVTRFSIDRMVDLTLAEYQAIRAGWSG